VAVFEPRPPPDYPAAAKFTSAPAPFVLNPPLSNRQVFHPEEMLHFDLVLFGRIIDALPYFIFTFTEIGRRGLGDERGKFILERVDLVEGQTASQVYDGHSQTLSAYTIGAESEGDLEDYQASQLTLKLLTPLRLKLNGKLLTQLSFPLLFERLIQRLTLLISFYGSNGSLSDLASLYPKAKQIQVISDNTHWYDWKRYSQRQKAEMNLGGLKGEITFAGDLSPFMPWLKFGEQVNVGQGTSFGLGKYKI
jgi:hypothetical protein